MSVSYDVVAVEGVAERVARTAGIDAPIVVANGGDGVLLAAPSTGRPVVIIPDGPLGSKFGHAAREIAWLENIPRAGVSDMVRELGTVAGAGLVAWGLLTLVSATGNAAWGALALAGVGAVLWRALHHVAEYLEERRADRRGAELLTEATGDDGQEYVRDALEQAIESPMTSWWERVLLRRRLKALTTEK